jgi:universal stress protein E
MKQIRRILFAVRDPSARRQAGLGKVLDLTARLGASLELFHALSSPVFASLEPLTGVTLESLERDLLAKTRQRLEGIAAAGRARGLKVSCEVAWDYPPHEAVLRRAERAGADLIVAEFHKGRHRRPSLMQLTDWELLRASRLPVLLLRDAAPWHKPAVLAAVDPMHTHAKPLDLDDSILAAARLLGWALGGKLHAVHVCQFAALPARGPEAQRRTDRARFDKLVESTDITTSRRHLVYGDPADLIPKVARNVRAGIVVMGAVSRSGLKRLFIGSTAEQVLDELPCDVLVVKPAAFAKRLRAAPRGMRVVAPLTVPPVGF